MTFQPLTAMIDARDKADRERLRITHWQLNEAALMILANHPDVIAQWTDKPLLDREFLGIPLKLDRDDRSLEPHLAPLFELYGQKLLKHDYPGDILHGNALHRFGAAVRAALTESPPVEHTGNDATLSHPE